MFKPLSITQKYQIFFFFTAILPIIAFTILFFESTYVKFDQRVNNLVQSGILLIEDSMNDIYSELELSSEQAAVLAVNEEYNQFLKTGNYSIVNQLLRQYQQANNFDVVILFDRQGQIIDNINQTEPFNPASIQKRVVSGLKGKSTTGFQRFYTTHKDDVDLAFVSVTPISSPYTRYKVDSALLTGRYIRGRNTFSILSKIIPDHLLRFVELSDKGLQLEFTNRQNSQDQLLTRTLIQNLNTIQSKTDNPMETSRIFEEKVGRETYSSAIISLKNNENEIIGFIVLSIPKNDMAELLRDNLLIIGFLSLLTLTLVIFGGAWFQKDFVDLLSKLATGFKNVSRGNLSFRLSKTQNDSPEKLNTIANFNAMLDKLAENERLRNTFITTLTHDLRTPLLAQQRVVEIISSEFMTMSQQQREKLINGLLDNNQNLLKMVNTLLDVYQYEDGKVRLNIARHDLVHLIEDCYGELMPLASSKEIQLVNDITPHALPLNMDYQQLRRVFINLIGNAIQNIPKGSIVKVSIHNNTDNQLQIIVSDNGQGIQPEILANTFERYYTGHRTQKKIGSGLGLYICKMIVELHGGTIKVDSRLGVGTDFYITLPYNQTKGIEETSHVPTTRENH